MSIGKSTFEGQPSRGSGPGPIGPDGLPGGSGSQTAEVFVGRQPIFDRRQHVVGYELLFRDGQANRAVVGDHQAATASVVLNSLTEIGLKRIVGARAAWIKVSREFISEGLVQLLPKRAVLEILRGQVIDDELIAEVAELGRRGNKVALDGFRYTPDFEELLRVVDFVKLDLVELGREQFASEVARLRRYGVTLVAARVENQRELAFARQSGCERFQGYFFCRPQVMHATRIDANRQPVLDLLGALQDPDVELDELQCKIALDIGLSVRLLRYINSAFFGLRQPVRSIGQAMALLGVEKLKRWAALTLFASIENKPTELTITALVRARFCELAGANRVDASSDELFTVGLFSVIDALLDTPIEKALDGVPLAQDIRDALVKHAGPAGRLLECVIALEAAEFDRAEALLPTAGPLYMAALAWADEAAEPLFGR
ncbi:MAG: EAL and HDOD domain-containing protein [Solirubrobacteraceae bacterium]